jgi:hypothetical protein
MRKRIFFILFGLCFTLPALAQTASFVTMIGTNASYPNGTLTANFLPPANSSQFDYFKYRFPFTVTGYLNSSGVWSMSLADTSTVLPASSQWRLQLCSAATFGAATCYTVTTAVTCVNNGSCSGTTLDLSSSFSSAPAPPTGTGNTTSTALTTNRLSKANGPNSIVDSLFADTGTAGSYAGTAGFSSPILSSSTAGSAGSPSLTSTVDATSGWHYPAVGQAAWASGGFDQIILASSNAYLRSTLNLRWNSGGPSSTGNDTGFSRSAAGIVCADTTTAGNCLGSMKAANVQAGVVYSAAGTALPSCVTGLKGTTAVVSDATGAPPVYLATYTSGGSTVTHVLCNGTAWVTD